MLSYAISVEAIYKFDASCLKMRLNFMALLHVLKQFSNKNTQKQTSLKRVTLCSLLHHHACNMCGHEPLHFLV